MCNCIEKVNRQLKDTGHRVATVRMCAGVDKFPQSRALVRSVAFDPMRRGRGPTVLATHCPWCGEKYGSAT